MDEKASWNHTCLDACGSACLGKNGKMKPWPTFSGMIEKLGGVRGISINRKTGSVLVEFDPEALAIEEVSSLARVAGIIGEMGEMIGEAETDDDNITWNELSILAKRLQKGFWNANRSVPRRRTDLPTSGCLSRRRCSCLGSCAPWPRVRTHRPPGPRCFGTAYSIFMHWQNPTQRLIVGSHASGK